MKRVALLLLALLVAVMAIGCAVSDAPVESKDEGLAQQEESEKSDDSKDETADAEDAATEDLAAELTLWSMPLGGESTEDMLTNDLIAGFNEMYPNVKINLEMLTWEAGPEKLQVALGTGTTPDLYIDGTARTAGLPSKNVLVDISDVIAKYQDDYYPALLNIGKVDGKNYILPIMSMTVCNIGVNVDLAKELGTYEMLPEDHISWTWDDLYNFCKATTDAGKDQGIYSVSLWAGSQSSDINYYSMMMSNGGEILNTDHTECIANGTANVAVLETLGKLVQEGIAFPGAPTMKDEDMVPLFLSSKVVMDMSSMGSYYLKEMQKMEADGTIEKCPEIEIFMFPTADGKTGQRSGSWGANTMVAFKNEEDAAKIQASKAFMEYYLSRTDFQSQFCALAGNTPIFEGVDVPIDDPDQKVINDQLAEWTGEYVDASFGILEPYWAECRATFFPQLQAFYSGDITAQEALDAYKADMDEVLAKQ